MRDTLTEANIQKGAAAAGEMGEFVFAVTADKQPNLVISAPRTGDAPPVAATKVGGLWVYQGNLKTGTAYRYTWLRMAELSAAPTISPHSAPIATARDAEPPVSSGSRIDLRRIPEHSKIPQRQRV